jgi:hypothetical protein
MNYQFENLGPERFQELCQSLLAAEYHDLRCFPVSQADGGRDASVRDESAEDGAFVVFQVKFVHDPRAIKDRKSWIEKILRAETAKIRRLAKKGMTSYHILTNVHGTAGLDVGTIDFAESLVLKIGLPITVRWRDDISRRLDLLPDLRMSYPALVTGEDALRVLLKFGAPEEQRRSSAFETFLRTQFERDKEVRFKQVELHNHLMRLFTDVPARLIGPSTATLASDSWARVLRKRGIHRGGGPVGAAAFLLSPPEPALRQVVLIGAPGQGKSTVTQFVCQVHRQKLLGVVEPRPLDADIQGESVVRFPIRADLRDYATWLRRRNPFESGDQPLDSSLWHKSLEAFLAALVQHDSGGVTFSVADLHFLLKSSPVVVVLDGLDEVADPQGRSSVVSEVQTSTARLQQISRDLQVIVTSRPAAFANSPGLPQEHFSHIQLMDLTRESIEKYADRWISAGRLTPTEGLDTKATLRIKLEQPHFLALARNAMQLAILLSLVHTRGSSLPDKRTALYSSYVDLFFSREAEKSAVVRDNRELLLAIHGHLGWILHGESESGAHSGAIPAHRLKSILLDYLNAEGRDPKFAEILFEGMVERVVFLVSRIEGTFEFEVQPLREFFAARHLYETSPYSPPGMEQPGTKPDRFDALALNFYWLNVTRFFAGFFSKGELPVLFQRVHALREHRDISLTGYPHRLIAFLLADWVFSQDAWTTRDAVAFVIQGLKAGVPFREIGRGTGDDPRDSLGLLLPETCGQEEVATCCRTLLESFPSGNRYPLLSIVESHSSEAELDAWWRAGLRRHRGTELASWLKYGSILGALARCPDNELLAIPQGDLATPANLMTLVQSGRGKLVEDSPVLMSVWLTGWLNGRQRMDGWFLPSNSSIHQLSALCALIKIVPHLELPEGTTLRQVLAARLSIQMKDDDWLEVKRGSDLVRCLNVLRQLSRLFDREAGRWRTSLDPWVETVACLTAEFGDSIPSLEVALATLGLKADSATTASSLLDASTSLCDRVQFAKLKSGDLKWWKEQLANAESENNRVLVLAVLRESAGGKVLRSLRVPTTEMLESLSLESWLTLADVSGSGRERTIEPLDIRTPTERQSARYSAYVFPRLKKDGKYRTFDASLKDYSGSDPAVHRARLEGALSQDHPKIPDWDICLEVARTSLRYDPNLGSYWLNAARMLNAMPLSIARKVMEQPGSFPGGFVEAAVRRCNLSVVKRIRPVAAVAAADTWFGEGCRP